MYERNLIEKSAQLGPHSSLYFDRPQVKAFLRDVLQEP
jgi:hypothetical protein